MKAKINDIKTYEENSIGNDWIIGDVHGNDKCFSKALELIGESDRLFVVGDWIDKGQDNVEVIKRARKNKDRVFSVRGNHDESCLKTIRLLEVLFELNSRLFDRKLPEELSETNVNIFLSVSDTDIYGEEYLAIKNILLREDYCWLIQLFFKEIEEGKISVTLLEGDEDDRRIFWQDNSNVKIIKDFLKDLPYIIHVKGANPFNLVHADMPFSDEELRERIHFEQNLSRREKHYAMNARKNIPNSTSVRMSDRNPSGHITYTGHSPLIIPNTEVESVRYESNTVNIDSLAFYSNVYLAVNHTKRETLFVGEGMVNDVLHQKRHTLDKHLRLQAVQKEAPPQKPKRQLPEDLSLKLTDKKLKNNGMFQWQTTTGSIKDLQGNNENMFRKDK